MQEPFKIKVKRDTNTAKCWVAYIDRGATQGYWCTYERYAIAFEKEELETEQELNDFLAGKEYELIPVNDEDRGARTPKNIHNIAARWKAKRET